MKIDRSTVEQAQEEVPWLRVIDEAMIDHHIGVADVADDYETAKRKLNILLCCAQDIGAYFAKKAEPQEPVPEPVPQRWIEAAQVVLSQVDALPHEMRRYVTGAGMLRSLIEGDETALEPAQEPCNKSCAPGYCYCAVQEPYASYSSMTTRYLSK